MIMISQFLHADHIDWLDILPFGNWVEDIVGEDFIVFNDTSELKFLNSISNIELFDILTPDKAYHFSFEDSFSQSIEISVFFIDFNFEDNNWFSEGFFLLFDNDWLFDFGDNWGIIVWSEQIVFSSFGFGLNFRSFFFGGLFNPFLHDVVGETVDEKIPIVSVREWSDFGEFWY